MAKIGFQHVTQNQNRTKIAVTEHKTEIVELTYTYQSINQGVMLES